MNTQAIFLDRDGTLIEEKGFICNFEEIEFFPFTIEALRIFKSLGLKLVLVTNQSAVARGLCSFKEISRLHQLLNQYLKSKGVELDSIIFCPYHPQGIIKEFKKDSRMRKPAPGMILKACKELKINPRSSLTIGDSIRDIIAGKRAKTRTALVKTGKGKAELESIAEFSNFCDFIFENLLQAALFFEKNFRLLQEK